MADSEFEEFRQYFDQLPQYIKAPSNIYTLVHNIDVGETPVVEEKVLNFSSDNKVNSGSGDYEDQSENVIREPFSGDLQLVIPEQEEKKSPILTRKRRKLPEIPKNPPRRWNEETKQISLAEEILEADRHNWNNQITSLQNIIGLAHSQVSHSSLPISSSYSQQRPIFVLKFNHELKDDLSSPDSEKYTSLDSGHSTIHSDDGSPLKYSPQFSSINESYSPSSPSLSGVPFSNLEILEATHRGLHKFIPRHHDEIEIEIGDPIYMQREADDLWCEGVNLRSGMQGIFPSAYVVDVDYEDFDPNANKVKKERYLINYIGSIETLYHKGNEVLCQAVKKIAGNEGYVSSHTRPCILEISDQGIKMLDKGKPIPNHVPCHDYFYALKNISFCGFHPHDHRYFGFVTKHPTLNRFACHVFISNSNDSTRPVAQAVGRAFQRFYQKFIETAYPIEDIYME